LIDINLAADVAISCTNATYVWKASPKQEEESDHKHLKGDEVTREGHSKLFSLQNINLRYGQLCAITDIYLTFVHLRIMRGSLVMVIGRVGNGKSSLLSAILGEMECVYGTNRSKVNKKRY